MDSDRENQKRLSTQIGFLIISNSMLHFRKGRATNKEEVKIEDHHNADNALSVARAALLQDSQLPGADRLPADCSV